MTSCWFGRYLMMINRYSIYSSRWRWNDDHLQMSIHQWKKQFTRWPVWTSWSLEAGLQEDSDQHNKEGNIYGVIIYNILWTAHIEIIFIRCWFIFIHIPMRECISVLGQSQVWTYAEKVGLFLIGELSDRVGWSAKHAGSETATCSTGTSGRRPIPCQSKTRQEWSEHLCLELFDRRK